MSASAEVCSSTSITEVISQGIVFKAKDLQKSKARGKKNKDQGQVLCDQGLGKGQSQCHLSSRRLKIKAKSSRTHHWTYGIL